jgi:hypothetical protein
MLEARSRKGVFQYTAAKKQRKTLPLPAALQAARGFTWRQGQWLGAFISTPLTGRGKDSAARRKRPECVLRLWRTSEI